MILKMAKTRMNRLYIAMVIVAMGMSGTASGQTRAEPLSTAADDWTTTNDGGVFADTWTSGSQKLAFILAGQLAWSAMGNAPIFELRLSGFKIAIPDGTSFTLKLSFDGANPLQLPAEASGGMITGTLPGFMISTWTHDLTADKKLVISGILDEVWTISLVGTTPTVNAMADAIAFSGAANVPAPFSNVAYTAAGVFAQPITEMADFTQSGYRFVVFDRTLTRPDSSVQSGTRQTTRISVEIPQIIDPLTRPAIAFNKAVIGDIGLTTNAFGIPYFKYENSHYNYLMSAGVSTTNSKASEDVPDMLPGVASFGFDISQYCNGCSVQRNWPMPINWIIARKRPVAADDIFNPATNWQQALTDQACTRSTGCGLLYLTNLPVEADFPPSWLLSREGILIMFSAEDPASNMYEGAEGTVFVPWASLKPYLKKDGLVPDQ